jgi:hypothetical protein
MLPRRVQKENGNIAASIPVKSEFFEELRRKITLDMGAHIGEYGYPYYEDNH